MSNWNALPACLKLSVLRYLTEEELANVLRADPGSRRLVDRVLGERSRALVVLDDNHLFLPLEAVVWALTSDRMLRSFFPVRDLVPDQVTIGAQIGSGGTNSVHVVQENPFLLIKDAGAKSGLSREYQSMVTMESLGLQTCLRSLHFAEDKLRIIMRRIEGCMDSKTIIGYKRDLTNYVDPAMDFPAPNLSYAVYIKGHSLLSLLEIWDIMTSRNTSFGDFQFLLDSEGEVFLNDPTETKTGQDRGTRTIIQAMIDTYEYLFHREGRGRRTWKNFKQYKSQLSLLRLRSFGSALRGRFVPPAFCVIDFRFCRWEMMVPPVCTLFLSESRKDLVGFARFDLEDGTYGYAPTETQVKKFKMLEWDTW